MAVILIVKCVFFFVWTLEHLKILSICLVCRCAIQMSGIHGIRINWGWKTCLPGYKIIANAALFVESIHMTKDNEITRLEYMFIRTHDKTLNFAVFFSIRQRIVYECECVFVRMLRYFSYTFGFFCLRFTVVLLF